MILTLFNIDMFDAKRFRKDKNLTQKQLADLFRCGQSNVSAIEKYGKDLEPYQQSILADTYGAEDIERYIIDIADNPTDVNRLKPEAEDPYVIPLIPDSALAGPLPDFSSPVVRDRCERVHVPVPDCDFAIQISGDSMAPEYKPGDYIAVSRINDRRFIPSSTPLLLDTTEGAVLKCLEPGDDPDCLSAVSLNPHYLPYQIPKDIIRGIYRIKAVVRIIKTL